MVATMVSSLVASRAELLEDAMVEPKVVLTVDLMDENLVAL